MHFTKKIIRRFQLIGTNMVVVILYYSEFPTALLDQIDLLDLLDLLLIAQLFPSTQVKVPGDYMAYKVSLKCGSLEFVTTLKPEVSQEMTVTVQPTQVNADISLTPTIGGRSMWGKKGGLDKLLMYKYENYPL